MSSYTDDDLRSVIESVSELGNAQYLRTETVDALLGQLRSWLPDHDWHLQADTLESAASALSYWAPESATEWLLNKATEIRAGNATAFATPTEPPRCPTPGCSGDARYMPPGRGHIFGCKYDPLGVRQETL